MKSGYQPLPIDDKGRLVQSKEGDLYRIEIQYRLFKAKSRAENDLKRKEEREKRIKGYGVSSSSDESLTSKLGLNKGS